MFPYRLYSANTGTHRCMTGFEDKRILKLIRAYNGLHAALQGKVYGLIAEMGKQRD